MNRRGFLFGGALGLGSGFLASVATASRPETALVPCTGLHEPVEGYLEQSAIMINTKDDPPRNLVPCKRCGALFAVPYVPRQRYTLVGTRLT